MSDPATPDPPGAERRRLAEEAGRTSNWKRWGPYLAERQWGTVREDYSADGSCWDYFPHDMARSRAYRWGEDGLLGLSDRGGRLCFAFALWNGRDPILKERLFGLSGPEGNHGEDVKECYYYLDGTPTHSYMRALYKYPQAEFPYRQLVEGGRTRGLDEPELELVDTGVFDGQRYFDVVVEYAKAAPEEILIRLTVHNRGPERAPIHILPTLWFRNVWSWGRTGEDYGPRPNLTCAAEADSVVADHATLGRFRLSVDAAVSAQNNGWLFTDNETNTQRLFGQAPASPWVKDAFHERVVAGRTEVVNPAGCGTKAAAWLEAAIEPGAAVVVRLRLRPESSPAVSRPDDGFGPPFDAVFAARIEEADEFHASLDVAATGDDERAILRQARAGLLWSKQFYHFDVASWLEGDPANPRPPGDRHSLRNRDWLHLYNRDVIAMPDKWEYPWYATWDSAFQMVTFAHLDPEFAKQQLLLFTREWYMHPNGQLPAYEFAFGDVNPPVHAWACWRVYKMTGARGARDRGFLQRAFHKLLINFTWWVNRKDPAGDNLFAGGFLGLDNIGLFDRSQPLPGGGRLEQADGTAWMAFFCSTMLAMALELASEDPAYEDVASKFFEHFVAIAAAMNTLGGTGLWDETDGYYYDQILTDGERTRLRLRSIVGIIPLFAVEVLEADVIDRLDGFKRRMRWFLANQPALARHVTEGHRELGQHDRHRAHDHGHTLLAIASRARLERVLQYVLDEAEFLSPHGIRSLSRHHHEHPYRGVIGGEQQEVSYASGESNTRMFGGNSNWRGPVWFPLNYLLIESLQRYHHFYGDGLRVEFPTGSGQRFNLSQVATMLARHLTSLFVPDGAGYRPCHGRDRRYAEDPHWRDLVLFHEFFDGESGRGLGASHQTGWTALVVRCIQGFQKRIARRTGD